MGVGFCLMLKNLLGGGFGQLADGPSFLRKEYFKVLEGFNLRPSLSQVRQALYWKDDSWIEINYPIHTLIIGDSAFVAKEFLKI
jgi:hypothetical protein